MRSRILLVCSFFFLPLLAVPCVDDPGPGLYPSLIDPFMVRAPFFLFEDRQNFSENYAIADMDTMTREEWRDYFKTRKKKEVSSGDIKSYLEGPDESPFPDVNVYQKFMSDCESRGATMGSALYQFALEMAADKSKDPFLRTKYAYHTVRMAVMAEKWQDGIDNYNKLVAPLGITSLIRYRAKGYMARALYKTDKMEEALELYMDMFDQCPALRQEARRSVSILETQGTLTSMIGKMKPGHRKATAIYLRHLSGGRDFNSGTLAGMVESAPKESQTEMLLVRMLQDVEGDHFPLVWPHLLGHKATPAGMQPRPYNLYWYGRKETNFEPLIPVCEKAAGVPGLRRPALFLWAASYLSLLSGDLDRAEKNLKKAEESGVTDPSLAPELHMTRTILEMAKSETFPKVTQERLLLDLAWAKKQAIGWDKDDKDRRPCNRKLELTLYHTAIQKYLYMGDWPRACLLASACPPSPEGEYFLGNPIGLPMFLDLSSKEELLQVKALMMGTASTPLDTLMVRNTCLKVPDLDLLVAYKKAKDLDYAGALIAIGKVQGKYRDYFKTESRTGRRGWADYLNEWALEQGACFKGSALLFPKDIQFSNDRWAISQDLGGDSLDIVSFFKKMRDLHVLLEKARKTDPPLAAQTAFDLGRIYMTETLTGWPELRAWQGPDGKPDYYYASSGYPPFTGPDLDAIFEDHFKDYKAHTPYAFQVATKLFKEVVASKANKELAAQSLAYMVQMNYGGHAVYLAELRKDYQGTEFYKRYKTTCSLLR